MDIERRRKKGSWRRGGGGGGEAGGGDEGRGRKPWMEEVDDGEYKEWRGRV